MLRGKPITLPFQVFSVGLRFFEEFSSIEHRKFLGNVMKHVGFCTFPPGSRSCTLDQKARFRIFTGGLRRMCAGKFSRVEVAVPGARAGSCAKGSDSVAIC